MSYLALTNSARKSAEKNYKLKEWLEKAHMPILAEVFIATLWMSTFIAIFIAIILFIIFQFILFPILSANIPIPMLQFGTVILYVPSIPVLLIPLFVYIGYSLMPYMKAKARAKDIDAYLPYAANFVAAMAAANATPQKIFKSLSAQKHIYGEIADEAKWIYRDMTLLGTDLLTALKRAVKRSPSSKFQEFIQGIIGTLTSGGDLKLYFLNRAEYYMLQNRRDQATFIETLAFIAESYVIVAVAMPMFLMIILIITYWISGTGFAMGDVMMYVIAFIMLPIIHVGYVTVVKAMTPKV